MCYSDVLSIDHRGTILQQYSKEPLNGSTSRGTAINLQEELEEIAPFKGSYHFEPGIGNDGQDYDGNDVGKKPLEIKVPDFFQRFDLNDTLRPDRTSVSALNTPTAHRVALSSSGSDKQSASGTRTPDNFERIQSKLFQKQ